MSSMKHLILTVCAILSVNFALHGYTNPAEKKIIHFGWCYPRTAEELLKLDLREFEAHCPFDGIGIYPHITLQQDGKTVSYNPARSAGNPPLLKWEDLQELVPGLRRLQETRLKHNFIRSNCSIFNGNWFDDEAWKRSLNCFSLLARLAKEAGFEGLCLDPEGYPYTKMPFMFRPEYGHTFEETAAQVRKRGKKWIEELNRQFPDLTLFVFFRSICISPRQAEHPELFSPVRDALLEAFFNGVYDGAPETMRIVDGQETPGYYASSDMDYARIVTTYHRFGDAWIDKANRDKYKKITSMGMSLYLDSYIKREKPVRWDHHNNPLYSDLAVLLAHNVANCLNHADEYVWLWCENGTFWPGAPFSMKGKTAYKFWDEVIPHCTEAIQFGMDWSKGLTPAAGRNIVRNGTLEPGGNGSAEGPDRQESGISEWSSWQAGRTPKGTIVPENGMVRFVNVIDGSIAQSFDVKPGKKYILTARCKNESRVSTPQISFFFSDAAGQGLWDIREYDFFTEQEADGWTRGTMRITIPDGRNITQLTITVGVVGDQDPSGKDQGVLFDDVALYEVEYPWEKN